MYTANGTVYSCRTIVDVYVYRTGVDVGSKLIQFRLSGKELEALEAMAEGESVSLIAQRLVKEALGVSTNVDAVDADAVRQIVRDEVEGLLTSLQTEHERLAKELASLKKPSEEPQRWSQALASRKKS